MVSSDGMCNGRGFFKKKSKQVMSALFEISYRHLLGEITGGGGGGPQVSQSGGWGRGQEK